jgi:hypothetical protein
VIHRILFATRTRRAFGVATLLLSLGCAEPIESDPDGAPGAGKADELTGGTAVDSDGPADSDGPTDGTDSHGPVAPEDRLFPVEVGRSWTYELTYPTGMLGVCPPGATELVQTITEAIEFAGRMAFKLQSACGGTPIGEPAIISVEGDQIETFAAEQWLTTLDEPIEDGHTWSSQFMGEAVLSDAGTVTVPAGTFDRCWTVTADIGMGIGSTGTFCRGVGLVRSASPLGPGGAQLEQALTSRNFE